MVGKIYANDRDVPCVKHAIVKYRRRCKLTWWTCILFFTRKFVGDYYQTIGTRHWQSHMETEHSIYITYACNSMTTNMVTF
jgi:hypothetical protein